MPTRKEITALHPGEFLLEEFMHPAGLRVCATQAGGSYIGSVAALPSEA